VRVVLDLRASENLIPPSVLILLSVLSENVLKHKLTTVEIE
jgi:hypothetical protein